MLNGKADEHGGIFYIQLMKFRLLSRHDKKIIMKKIFSFNNLCICSNHNLCANISKPRIQ
jgi:hypothetical protein